MALLLTLTSCSETIESVISDYSPSLEARSLSVTPRDFTFTAEGGNKKATITATSDWNLNGLPEWVTATPAYGSSGTNTITFTTPENSDASARQAVAYVTSSQSGVSMSRAVSISQEAAKPYITLTGITNNTINVSGAEQTIDINYQTNLPDVKMSFTYQSGEDWMSRLSEGKVQLKKNDSNSTRVGYITLSSQQQSVSQTITVFQAAGEVNSVSLTELTFGAEGGTESVTIDSEVDWTAEVVPSNIKWFTVSPANGKSGKTTVEVTCSPVTNGGVHTGQIEIAGVNGSTKYVSVTQKGAEVNVSPTSLTFEANGSEVELTVQSNVDWKVVPSFPDWISYSQESGTAGITSLTVTASKNNSVNSRSGTFCIYHYKSLADLKRVSVYQNGLNFDGKTLGFLWQEDTRRLSVPFESWDAAVSAGWISLSKYSGGAEDITVSIARNEDEDPRTGSIIFTSEGKSYTVNVVQEGQYLKIDNASGDVSAMGGTIKFSIATSVGDKPSVEYEGDTKDWISVNEIFSADAYHADYTLGIAYNNSINPRTANCVITPTMSDVTSQNAAGVKYRIKQAGRQLSVNTSKIDLIAAGGNSQPFTVTCDGDYTITKGANDNWYSVVNDPATKTFYLVATENQTDDTRTSVLEVSLSGLPDGETKTLTIEVEQLNYGAIVITIDDNNNTIVW